MNATPAYGPPDPPDSYGTPGSDTRRDDDPDQPAAETPEQTEARVRAIAERIAAILDRTGPGTVSVCGEIISIDYDNAGFLLTDERNGDRLYRVTIEPARPEEEEACR